MALVTWLVTSAANSGGSFSMAVAAAVVGGGRCEGRELSALERGGSLGSSRVS